MSIVVVGDLSNYFSSRDRHTMYIDASLSVMAFLYALETIGLSSVVINWPDFGLLEKKMKKKLNLKTYERPIMLLAVGYAKEDGMIPCSKKKPLEELRSYNDLGISS
jgi:nitroreductase